MRDGNKIDKTSIFSLKIREKLLLVLIFLLSSPSIIASCLPSDNSNILYYEIGKKIFNDSRLSIDNEMSCASCHNPNLAFQDGYERALSRNKVLHRNTPTTLNVQFYDSFFWDGRAESLIEQIKEPIQSINELGASKSHIKEYLIRIYNSYNSLSGGECEPIDVISELISYYLLEEATTDTIFSKTEFHDLSENIKNGYNIFVGKGMCSSCHSGKYYTDNKFHDNGLSRRKLIIQTVSNPGTKGRYVLGLDYGRGNIVDGVNNFHKFRTPTLINSYYTAPYMHNGYHRTLREVIEFYDRGGDTPSSEISPLNLTNKEKHELLDFLKSLSDPRLIFIGEKNE